MMLGEVSRKGTREGEEEGNGQRYGEDEAGTHGHGAVSFKLGNGIEHGADVVLLCQSRRGHGTWGDPQLEVDDAIGGEVSKDGKGGVGERPGIVDKVVRV